MYPLYNVSLSDIKDDQTLADYIETIKQREYERGYQDGLADGYDTDGPIKQTKNGVGY